MARAQKITTGRVRNTAKVSIGPAGRDLRIARLELQDLDELATAEQADRALPDEDVGHGDVAHGAERHDGQPGRIITGHTPSRTAPPARRHIATPTLTRTKREARGALVHRREHVAVHAAHRAPPTNASLGGGAHQVNPPSIRASFVSVALWAESSPTPQHAERLVATWRDSRPLLGPPHGGKLAPRLATARLQEKDDS